MKFWKNIIYLLIVSYFFISFSAFAQTEEELDMLLLQDNDNVSENNQHDTNFNETIQSNPFSFSGFAQIMFNSTLNERPFQENEIFSSEIRAKLKPQYSKNKTRLYADIDFYNDYSNENPVHEKNSFEFTEAYVEHSGIIIMKAGKQRFNWGVGDAFQPVNIIDQQDMRASFMTENDDRYTGVQALSLKYISGDYSIETVLRPVTDKALYPKGFYMIENKTIDTPLGKLNPRYSENDTLYKIKDFSYGLRAGGTTNIFDWHIMYFNGMNRELIFQTSVINESGTLYLDMKPVYERVNAFGFDLSFALSKFNFRLEGFYSPDMTAVSDLNEKDTVSALNIIASGKESSMLQKTEHRDFYSYSAGFDINLWGDNGNLFLEWMQARYIDEDDVTPILLTDVMMIRLEDSWFNESVNVSLGSMIRKRHNDPGAGFNGEIEYDLKNGFTVTIGNWYFIGNDDEYVQMIEDKNLVYLNAKFEF